MDRRLCSIVDRLRSKRNGRLSIVYRRVVFGEVYRQFDEYLYPI